VLAAVTALGTRAKAEVAVASIAAGKFSLSYPERFRTPGYGRRREALLARAAKAMVRMLRGAGARSLVIRSVLVGLDTNAIAPRVLAVATEVAERLDARMFLFRAVPVAPELPAAAANATRRHPLARHLAAEAARDLQRLAAGNPRASAADPIVCHGDPWRAILETGDRLDVDLIVVGSHLYHGPDRVLGTVAGNLANRGHRNLLVVRS
jgi:nucleotide-binding universal stress UspA family protein